MSGIDAWNAAGVGKLPQHLGIRIVSVESDAICAELAVTAIQAEPE